MVGDGCYDSTSHVAVREGDKREFLSRGGIDRVDNVGVLRAAG